MALTTLSSAESAPASPIAARRSFAGFGRVVKSEHDSAIQCGASEGFRDIQQLVNMMLEWAR
jgi:hypothetical protein